MGKITLYELMQLITIVLCLYAIYLINYKDLWGCQYKGEQSISPSSSFGVCTPDSKGCEASFDYGGVWGEGFESFDPRGEIINKEK